MPIVERVMKPGSWDLQLIPETPKTIRDVLKPFGHLVVYEARVDPRIMADADLLANALYVGIVRRNPTPISMAGAGMTAWLGDEEGKGAIPEGVPPAAGTWTGNLTFVNWINGILNVANQPVTAGTITAIGAGTLNTSFTRVSQRTAIDFICAYFTGEYIVKNNGTIDAGPPATIFPTTTTPTVALMPRDGGRDTGMVGIQASVLNVEIDADSYTQRVFLVGAAGTGAANQGTAPYKDIHGNTLLMTRIVQSSQTPAGAENTIAAQQLGLYPLRQVITLNSNRYNIRHDIQAGDWIYAYDPEHDLVDLTNEQRYRGQIVWPLKLRVYALTWPVETGMSVYYRDLNGAYTDLTQYVIFENPGTTFEVGSPTRGLTVF